MAETPALIQDFDDLVRFIDGSDPGDGWLRHAIIETATGSYIITARRRQLLGAEGGQGAGPDPIPGGDHDG